MGTMLDVRPSPIAGQWYPGDPQLLAKEVDGYIKAANIPPTTGEVVGLISPHAGHIYSGPVAGFAFKTVLGKAYDIVVIVSPMHQPYYEPILTTAHAAYGTPLGVVPVEKEALEFIDRELIKRFGVGLAPVANDREHSLEIELPFLQRALQARTLGKAISALFDEGGLLAEKSVLFVASTDLSHFYPKNVADRLDGVMLHAIEKFDPDEVVQVERDGRGFACGRGAVATVLWATKMLGANHVHILKHATSGDVTGDFTNVVGYGAAVITRE